MTDSDNVDWFPDASVADDDLTPQLLSLSAASQDWMVDSDKAD